MENRSNVTSAIDFFFFLGVCVAILAAEAEYCPV